MEIFKEDIPYMVLLFADTARPERFQGFFDRQNFMENSQNGACPSLVDARDVVRKRRGGKKNRKLAAASCSWEGNEVRWFFVKVIMMERNTFVCSSRKETGKPCSALTDAVLKLEVAQIFRDIHRFPIVLAAVVVGCSFTFSLLFFSTLLLRKHRCLHFRERPWFWAFERI